MQPPRTLRCLDILIGVLALTPLASAQLTTIEDYHGHMIGCSVSGLRGAYGFCATDKILNYEYVFVGSIVSIANIGEGEDHEFSLRISPEEIFLGEPAAELTVTTEQGECLDHDNPFQIDDRWLFYVRRDKKSKELFVWWGGQGGSHPADTAATEIDLLRLQFKNPESGLVTGNVTIPGQLKNEDGAYEDTTHTVSGHKLIAKLEKDGPEFSVVSDSDGNFLFPPLAPGKYKFTANTSKGWWAEDVTIDVEPRGCADVGFELAPDGTISGRVLDAQGKPVQNTEVEVDHYTPILGTGDGYTNDDGFYEIRGLPPGRYLVGIGIRDSQPAPLVTAYYPNVSDSTHAIAITLGNAEHRDGVDIDMPK